MGVPVGMAGGAGRWSGGPACLPGPPPRHLSEVGTFPGPLFLGVGWKGWRTPPGSSGVPQILSIPRQRGAAWGWFPLPGSAGHAGGFAQGEPQHAVPRGCLASGPSWSPAGSSPPKTTSWRSAVPPAPPPLQHPTSALSTVVQNKTCPHGAGLSRVV